MSAGKLIEGRSVKRRGTIREEAHGLIERPVTVDEPSRGPQWHVDRPGLPAGEKQEIHPLRLPVCTSLNSDPRVASAVRTVCASTS